MCSESTSIETVTDSVPGSPSKYWPTKAWGPDNVVRPHLGEIKGYYYFFRSANPKMDSIWKLVKMSTENGNLGYYSGYSPDKMVIAIHFADPNDEKLSMHIEEWLNENGIVECKFNVKEFNVEEEQDLYDLRPIKPPPMDMI